MNNVEELASWIVPKATTDDDFEVLEPFTVPVTPAPMHVLPKLLKQFAEAAARSLNCPVDYVFMPLLMLSGSAIGRNRVALPKPDWKEFAVIWLGIVGDPSTGKTPAIGAVTEPLKRIQRDYYRDFEFQMEEYADNLARWQKDKKHNEKPEEPRMKLVFTTDATLEALRDLLTMHPKGITLLQGELKGWLLSMNQYKGSGRGNDRQVWLDLWSSELSATARKSGSVIIPDPFVGVIGGLQPDVLESLTTEGRDGFIARVLLIQPDRPRLQYDADSSIPETLQNEWRRVFGKLWDLQPDEDNEPVKMPFTPAAKHIYSEWLNKYHLVEIERGNLSVTLVDAWSKLRAYAVRIAMILQCLRVVYGEAKDGEIDEISVSQAIDVVEYCKTHLKRSYNDLRRNPNQEWISGILNFLRNPPRDKDSNFQQCTPRNVQRARILPHAFNKASEVERLFHEIADLGYAKMDRTAKGSLRLYLPVIEDGDSE